MAELLTLQIARDFQARAQSLPTKGILDIGDRRKLRIELQNRCGLTELAALNILNGYHVHDYIAICKINEENRQRRSEELKGGNESE